MPFQIIRNDITKVEVDAVVTYSGFTAQIIQHEIDHCNGVLI